MQNNVQDGGVRGTAVGGGTGYSASVGARHKNNAGVISRNSDRNYNIFRSSEPEL